MFSLVAVCEAAAKPPSALEAQTAAPNRRKRKRSHPHPYLSGNFAPIHAVQPLTPCTYSGEIPEELVGGEYVRNGGNPVSNEDLGRDAHWFDGDGMLSGVSFTRTEDGVQPEFVNQYILTDLYLSTTSSKNLHRPILPSIATLVDPLSSLLQICWIVFRTIFLVILSRLPGSIQAIKKISVANTGILFHDGRALATCESGPPMRVSLPGLETVGWYNGKKADGEADGEEGTGFGGEGIVGFMKEWTTAHPRVDPRTGELILFHSTFAPPHIHYSIIPATHTPSIPVTPLARPTRLLNAPVPGVSSAKMMHDFGVSFDHTIIMDLPLSLDPLNLVKNKPVVAYDPKACSRFGVFPRHFPQQIRWFETAACCIFHTANSWDDQVVDKSTGRVQTTAVNVLACRLNSASLVFSAGDITAPQPTSFDTNGEEEQCRLYYYQFPLADASRNDISYQFALSAISFEFPSIREDRNMSRNKFVYGCSTSEGTFGAALGGAVKIDCLVKMNAEVLIQRGKKDPYVEPVTGCVDMRTVSEVMTSTDKDDPIQIFQLPKGFYAQEPRFVPRKDGVSEDDGWLVTYVFDESQLQVDGECRPDAKSELWVINAKDMKTVVGRVYLTQRVPYGLHGNFFSEQQVKSQRPVETIRAIKRKEQTDREQGGFWPAIRDRLEVALA
jgi:carotenoid cleavage dioxygenase-like enzyme